MLAFTRLGKEGLDSFVRTLNDEDTASGNLNLSRGLDDDVYNTGLDG
jgi:hypothetical protein